MQYHQTVSTQMIETYSVSAKRTIKDSVFSDLFQNKKYLMQLYQTLHPEDKKVMEQSFTDVTIMNVLTVTCIMIWGSL